LISSLIGPTAYWALILRPDGGRPTLHGWWAPVALRYKRRWGPAAHSTRLTVSHSAPPTTRVRSESVRSQRREAPLPSPPPGLRYLDVFTATVDFTASLPLLPAVADFTDRRCPCTDLHRRTCNGWIQLLLLPLGWSVIHLTLISSLCI
jgi:hypothetical protein